MDKEKKEGIIKGYARHEGDTGSAEVQVALLTERINELTGHLRIHRHDNHSRRGMLMLVSQRRRQLTHLLHEDRDRYQNLITRLGLRR